ncbi:twin-arginine translocase subunit TatB [Chimaeribacter californicus]|uniref:Sec-independent protein translocase protein TatB n=1 Tax=Chimaeribacter californicus TaxID=2060067 RepID=A0A2N5E1P2_9GAMM|nr:Sec-independent protein translocase protein TatB [Chimaeribacter californicus]PLR34359.1 twin-arginine translocase subunit TatB [Chimaeribacter californicus]
MFDIGFSELLLVMVIGLVVLGPERLPVAVRTVAGWIRALRSLAASVQTELAQELKLQELQDSLKKAEEAGLKNLTPELKASMDELKEAAESMKRSYSEADEAARTIHQPAITDPEALHDGVTPGDSATVASAPAAVPDAPVLEKTVPVAPSLKKADVSPAVPVSPQADNALPQADSVLPQADNVVTPAKQSVPQAENSMPQAENRVPQAEKVTLPASSSHQPTGDR